MRSQQRPLLELCSHRSTGVTRPELGRSVARGAAAPRMRPLKRARTWCAAVTHATDVSAGSSRAEASGLVPAASNAY
jgi:hypothetical protein